MVVRGEDIYQLRISRERGRKTRRETDRRRARDHLVPEDEEDTRNPSRLQRSRKPSEVGVAAERKILVSLRKKLKEVRGLLTSSGRFLGHCESGDGEGREGEEERRSVERRAHERASKKTARRITSKMTSVYL